MYKDCYNDLAECVQACEENIKTAVLDRHAEAVQASRDCADICSLCMRFEARGSFLMEGVYELCAKICEETADICEDNNIHCAEICRKCANACKKS